MKGLAIEAFSEKARAHLGRGEIGLARECSTRAMELLEAHGGVIEQPYRFYFTHARVLEQSGQGDAARHYLERAWAQLQRVAQQIPDENLREHFLKGPGGSGRLWAQSSINSPRGLRRCAIGEVRHSDRELLG